MLIWKPINQTVEEEIRQLENAMIGLAVGADIITKYPGAEQAGIDLVSISLRKLLLDERNKPLLERCFDNPELHPLHKKRSLKGETTTSIIGFASGGELNLNQTTLHYIPSKFSIVVHPLHGIALHQSKFKTKNPFNLMAKAISIDNWLKQKLVKISGMEFSIRRILEELANLEAAHAVPEKSQEGKSLSLSNHYNIGGMNYPHIFALLTADYLNSVMKNTRGTADRMPRWSSIKNQIKPFTGQISPKTQAGIGKTISIVAHLGIVPNPKVQIQERLTIEAA